MRTFIWVALFAAACSGGDKGGTDDSGSTSGDGGAEGGDGGGGDGTTGGGGNQADFINTTKAPIGDFTGFEAGYTTAWLTQTVTQTGTVSLAAAVLDFQEDTPVADATVEFYTGDEVAAVPDVSGVSDAGGNLNLSLPFCTPLTYKTATDPALGDTKNTFEAHQVYGASPTGTDELNSVSTTTYQLIPSLLGVSVDPAKGTVAGTAYDVGDRPIEGAQVVVKSMADDSIPDDVVVKYFVNSFPNREQPETSADGLWVAINIPAGDWKVEMYVADGAGGHLFMGQTVLKVFGDSINISNIYTGYDSVKYPASCL